MQPEIEVEISNTQSHLHVNPAMLDRLVRMVLLAEDRPHAAISIAVVDNATIHAINRSHLAHDWPTDVITFPLGEPDEPVLAGELVVSAEMACSSARELGFEAVDELALYVVHGLLHLCGYDDHDDPARAQMRKREDELLSLAGFATPHAQDQQVAPAGHDRGTCEGPSRLPEDSARGNRLVAHDLGDVSWTG